MSKPIEQLELFCLPLNCGVNDWGLCIISLHNFVNSGILSKYHRDKQAVNYFRKMFRLKCLKGFWKHFCIELLFQMTETAKNVITQCFQ